MSTKPDEHASLSAALVAAQADMPAVEPDATNPHFKSRFVSLGNLVAKARPVLNRHGIAVAQFPSTDDQGKPTLVTLLLHGPTGERLEYAAPLMLPKADPQGQGSAITYMRRYALGAALGISDQEDDDGNSASPAVQAPKVQTQAEAERMYEAIQQAGHAPSAFLQGLGLPLDRALTLDEARKVRDALKAQAEAMQGQYDELKKDQAS